MKLDVNSREKADLLNREEIHANLNFSGSVPSRLDVRKELAKKANVKIELLVIKKIDPAFGESKAKVFAYVYKDEKSMKEVEPEYMIKRHEGKAKAEGEAAPAEQVKEKTELVAEEKSETVEEKPKEAPAEKTKADKTEEKPAEPAEKTEEAPSEKPAKKPEEPKSE